MIGFVEPLEVAGSELNRGAGCGLEIPCINRLYGPKPHTDSTKTATLGILKSAVARARDFEKANAKL